LHRLAGPPLALKLFLTCSAVLPVRNAVELPIIASSQRLTGAGALNASPRSSAVASSPPGVAGVAPVGVAPGWASRASCWRSASIAL